jgi:hypothetical protein
MPNRDVRQVNIRVSPEVHDALEAYRFAESLRGLQDVLEPVINEFADTKVAGDARVRAILAGKALPAPAELPSNRPTNRPKL